MLGGGVIGGWREGAANGRRGRHWSVGYWALSANTRMVDSKLRRGKGKVFLRGLLLDI